MEDVDPTTSNLMERKEFMVKVLIVIFMKHIENGSDSAALLEIFEKAFMIAMQEMVSENYNPSMQHNSSYYTQLLMLMNRGIVLSEEFRKNIFEYRSQQESIQFLCKWFDKMHFIMMNFARRINQLAIIKTLPLLSKEAVCQFFPKVAPNVFSAVESDIYINESKNTEDFYSPDKIENYETISVVKNVNAKGSKRLAALRAEDSLMNVSLVEEFINNMQAMWMKLEINENDLNELLSNDKEKLSFQNIDKQGAKYYSKD